MFKICTNIIKGFNIPIEENIKYIKEAGFDGVFEVFDEDIDFIKLNKIVKENGLFFDSIHGPYTNIQHMWNNYKNKGNQILNILKKGIDICEYVGSSNYIIHPFIGHKKRYKKPTEIGFLRFEELIKYALKKNINICFENVEGEIYLKALFDAFKDKYPNVKFCFDSGHELCYFNGRNLLEDYGSLLGYVHLNSNFGQSNKHLTNPKDDHHFLICDGILDINNLVSRLKKYHYQGNITFENKIKKGLTPIHDSYLKIGAKEFYKKSYELGENLKRLLKN